MRRAACGIRARRGHGFSLSDHLIPGYIGGDAPPRPGNFMVAGAGDRYHRRMTGSGPVATTASAVPPRHHAITVRLGAVMLSHTAVDVYSFFVPPLIGMLQIRCKLSDEQAAWMLGIGSLSSSGIDLIVGVNGKLDHTGDSDRRRRTTDLP